MKAVLVHAYGDVNEMQYGETDQPQTDTGGGAGPDTNHKHQSA